MLTYDFGAVYKISQVFSHVDLLSLNSVFMT